MNIVGKQNISLYHAESVTYQDNRERRGQLVSSVREKEDALRNVSERAAKNFRMKYLGKVMKSMLNSSYGGKFHSSNLIPLGSSEGKVWLILMSMVELFRLPNAVRVSRLEDEVRMGTKIWSMVDIVKRAIHEIVVEHLNNTGVKQIEDLVTYTGEAIVKMSGLVNSHKGARSDGNELEISIGMYKTSLKMPESEKETRALISYLTDKVASMGKLCDEVEKFRSADNLPHASRVLEELGQEYKKGQLSDVGITVTENFIASYRELDIMRIAERIPSRLRLMRIMLWELTMALEYVLKRIRMEVMMMRTMSTSNLSTAREKVFLLTRIEELPSNLEDDDLSLMFSGRRDEYPASGALPLSVCLADIEKSDIFKGKVRQYNRSKLVSLYNDRASQCGLDVNNESALMFGPDLVSRKIMGKRIIINNSDFDLSLDEEYGRSHAMGQEVSNVILMLVQLNVMRAIHKDNIFFKDFVYKALWHNVIDIVDRDDQGLFQCFAEYFPSATSELNAILLKNDNTVYLVAILDMARKVAVRKCLKVQGSKKYWLKAVGILNDDEASAVFTADAGLLARNMTGIKLSKNRFAIHFLDWNAELYVNENQKEGEIEISTELSNGEYVEISEVHLA